MGVLGRAESLRVDDVGAAVGAIGEEDAAVGHASKLLPVSGVRGAGGTPTASSIAATIWAGFPLSPTNEVL